MQVGAGAGAVYGCQCYHPDGQKGPEDEKEHPEVLQTRHGTQQRAGQESGGQKVHPEALQTRHGIQQIVGNLKDTHKYRR